MNMTQWSRAVERHVLAATLESEECARLASESGAATGLSPSARQHCEQLAQQAPTKWLNWARRCQLEPLKRLAQTLKTDLDGVVLDTLDGRSKAYVEAMNGLMQQSKTAARRLRYVGSFAAVAYLRMSTLKHLPANDLVSAILSDYAATAMSAENSNSNGNGREPFPRANLRRKEHNRPFRLIGLR